MVALTVNSYPYQGINKNPVNDMVSADSSIEPWEFVPGLYQEGYSAFNLTCIDIDGFHHSK